MDEKQISELLECSVCLERFDQTCKVLPCQHTFCRLCLDEILLTKHELRCPECRALVTIRVADLPTNILVVRILEGLKTKGQRPQGCGGGRLHDSIISLPSPSKAGGSSQLHRLDSSSLGHSFRQGTQQPCARALYNYVSSEKDDLPFRKGDIVLLRRHIDDNWYQGELAGRIGFLPANFIQVLVPLPQIPQCRALYDFQLKDESEKDCLSFKKDEVLTVIRRVDENWLEGRKGDKIGIFPITFIELNDAARSLINIKSNLTILPSSLSSTSFVQATSIATSSNSIAGTTSLISSSRNAAINNYNTSATTTSVTTSTFAGNASPAASFSSCDVVDGSIPISSSPSLPSTSAAPLSEVPPLVSSSSPQSEPSPTSSSPSSESACSAPVSVPEVLSQNKRHSYTSSSLSSPPPTTSATSHPHQRHSAEVTVTSGGTVTLLNSEVNTVTASSSSSSSATSLPSTNIDTHLAVSSPRNTPSLPDTVAETNNDTSASASNSVGGSVQSSSLTAPLYIALYNYKPQKEDELELHKGEHYSVVEKCQDGWYKGTCVQTNQAGVFPGNYVHMVRHSSAFKPVSPNMINVRGKSPPSSVSQSLSTAHSDQHPALPALVPSDVPTQAPPLMPRVAKMNMTGQKSRSPSSQLVGAPLRSFSNSGTFSSSSPKHMSPSSSALTFSHTSSNMGLSRPIIPAPPPSTVSSPHRSLWVPPSLAAMQHTMFASAHITPPNVVVAHGLDAPAASTSATSGKEKKEKKEKEKKSLVKLLAGKTKKSKTAPPDPEPPPPLAVLCFDNVAHVRSGSYPEDGPASHSMSILDTSSDICMHRKAASFDATTSPSVPSKPRPKPVFRERYCCIVPYPPQTEHELALELGDIIHVHRKREDGWYKGTQERTGKTGMFPASFVEKCD